MYAGLICISEQTNTMVESEMQRLWNLTKHNVNCILENVCHLQQFKSQHCKHGNEKRKTSDTAVELQARISCNPNQGKVL